MSVRTRGHSCSETMEGQEKSCTAPRCAYWSTWGAWASCSTSCGTGTVSRTRVCQGMPEFCATLMGERMETKSCVGGTGRDYYSNWSSCSVSCGTGIQTRTIQNTCSDIINQETQACTASMGAYTLWSEWSMCSTSCGGGLQQRRKSHSCGLPDYVQERSCNESPGSFGPWSQWSQCGVSCGGSSQTRQRVHSCTGEIEYDSQFCNTYPCKPIII